MKVKIYLDEEDKNKNIAFVEAIMNHGCFTVEDLQEICSLLLVEVYMFGSKRKGETYE